MSDRNRPPKDVRQGQTELLRAAKDSTDARVKEAARALEAALARRQAQFNSQRPEK